MITTFKKYHLKNVYVLVGLSFMFVDIILFSVYSLVGSGYILFEPSSHYDISSKIAQVWDILHAPVNGVFGPLLFPYFDAHSFSLSFVVYIALCFLQMFLVGFLVAIIGKSTMSKLTR